VVPFLFEVLLMIEDGVLPAYTQTKLRPDLITGMAHVQRWHSRPVLRSQTVAEHSHQVALLALHLAPNLSAETAAQTMFWALVHDMHEVSFGDIPFPAKVLMASMGCEVDSICQDSFWGGAADNPGRYMPDLVLDLVDVADALEAAIFASRWLPDAAEEVRAQALKKVHARLNRAETHVAYARAMQILEDLRHA
jgi:hypothetical protein